MTQKKGGLLKEIISIATSSAISGKKINLTIKGTEEVNGIKNIFSLSNEIKNFNKKEDRNIFEYLQKINALNDEIKKFHNAFLKK